MRKNHRGGRKRVDKFEAKENWIKRMRKTRGRISDCGEFRGDLFPSGNARSRTIIITRTNRNVKENSIKIVEY
jgi:hypothetical protein